MNKRQITMITWALILANIMAGLDATIINTAIPAIVSDLHGIQYMGWIVACFLLGMSVSMPIWSKLGERMGNKFAFELAISAVYCRLYFRSRSTGYLFLSYFPGINGCWCRRNGILALYYCGLYLS